jgi:multiple sugar transport system permease protein
MAGYAFAKYEFVGRTFLFWIILGTALVPPTVLVLPLFLWIDALQLHNTYWAILFPNFVSPFGVFFSRIYAAASIPDDVVNAARLDGAGEFRIFASIASLLIKPAFIIIFLFQFIAIWNNFLLSYVMIDDTRLYPLSVGLETWIGGDRAFLVTGALISACIPVVALIVMQNFLIREIRDINL